MITKACDWFTVRRWSSSTLLLSVLLSTAGFAGDLSLNEAMALAEAHDVVLRRTEVRLESYKVALKHPDSWRHPELRVGNQLENGSDDHVRVALRFRPPNYFEKSAEKKVISSSIEVAQSQFAQQRIELRAEISRLYYRAFYHSLLSGIARKETNILSRIQSTYLEQLERGNIRLADALDAQSDFAEARIRLSEVEHDKRAALIDLFDRIGVVWTPDHGLHTPFEPITSVATLTNQSTVHASLEEWRLRQKEVDEQIKREQAENRPSISFFQASYEIDAGRSDDNQWGFGLGVSIPVFNRTRREVAELNAKKKELVAIEGSFQRSIETLQNVTRENLVQAQRLVQDLTAEAQALKMAYGGEKILAAMTLNEERKYRVAQLDFERAVLRAHLDFQLALIDTRYLDQGLE